MVQKQDLKTLQFVATTTLQNVGLVGLGASAEGIPENMKRYIYYAKYHNPDSGYTVLTIYERLANVLDHVEDAQGLTQYTTEQIPRGGNLDPEKPIMTFRTSGFMAVQTSAPIAGSGKILVTLRLYDAPG